MTTFREIRDMADEQIVAAHDAGHEYVVWGQAGWQQEMARRDAERQGDRIEAMTRTMRNLTWAIAAMTLVSAVAAAVAALSAWQTLT